MRQGIFLLLLVCPMWVQAASFDCEKASSPREKLICSDNYLSVLDSDLSRLYGLAMAASEGEQKSGLLTSQRQWIKDSASRCPGQESSAAKCLVDDYEQRRSSIVDLLRAAVLTKAYQVKAGPYSFKQPRVPLTGTGDENYISYVVMIGGPDDVVESFNAIAVPPNKGFFNSCEEQHADSQVELATDHVVTLGDSSWMYCEGAMHGYATTSARSIVMQPKPHLIRTEDLFRADVAWQPKLADLCLDALKEDYALGADQEESLQAVRDLAAKPENWAVTQDALQIHFGFLAGYAGGDFIASITWNKLGGLLVSTPPFQ